MQLFCACLQGQLGRKGCCHAPRAEPQHAAALPGAAIRELALYGADPSIQAAHMCKVPGCNAAAGHCGSLPGLAGEAMNRLTSNPVESMCRQTRTQILFAFVNGVQTQVQHLLMGTNSIDRNCQEPRGAAAPQDSTARRVRGRAVIAAAVARLRGAALGAAFSGWREAASTRCRLRNVSRKVRHSYGISSQVEGAQQSSHGRPLHTCDHRDHCLYG
jgi:hypothetical protein